MPSLRPSSLRESLSCFETTPNHGESEASSHGSTRTLKFRIARSLGSSTEIPSTTSLLIRFSTGRQGPEGPSVLISSVRRAENTFEFLDRALQQTALLRRRHLPDSRTQSCVY